MKMIHYTTIFTFFFLVLGSTSVKAVEVIDKDGHLETKLIEGKMYDERGRYKGKLMPGGKMYDKDGNFTGQIKEHAIIDEKGDAKGYIRDGKIYDKDGQYKGELKK